MYVRQRIVNFLVCLHRSLTRLFVHWFVRTAHSFACSKLLMLLAGLFVRLLAHSRAHRTVIDKMAILSVFFFLFSTIVPLVYILRSENSQRV